MTVFLILFRIRIRQLVREAGRTPTPDQKYDIEYKRQRISARIRDFHKTSERLIGLEQTTSLIGKPDVLDADGYITDDIRSPEDRSIVPRMSEVENTVLAFPSFASNQSPVIRDLRSRELRLRRARANDSLGRIRESLSGLSYQYINKVRQSTTTKEHLRAYKGIRLLTQEVSFHRQVYNRTRRSLVRLDDCLKPRYPYLRRDECNISTAIYDVNARGQSQAKLAWFWGAVDGYDPMTAQQIGTDDERLLECTADVFT